MRPAPAGNAVRIGLIVNPLAGIGGKVALKGSDGALAEEALARGAKAAAADRTKRALASFVTLGSKVQLAGAGGEMGADEATACGLAYETLHEPSRPSVSEDTTAAARQLLQWRAELILFAGGDGTARDLMQAVGHSCPVLGIPAGVKMHSGVFARTPRDAGALAAAFAAQMPEDRSVITADVVDRNAQGEPELFGTMIVPRDPRRMQPAKASPGADEQAGMEGACRALAADIARDERTTIIGPGSTTLQLKQMLDPAATLLGVEVYRSGRLVAADADEQAILAAIAGGPARLILGVIGGQGFLLGRGNQQISADVVRQVGRGNILGLASAGKLALLPDRSLYADSGDEELDAELAGYVPVQVGASKQMMMPLNAHLRRGGGTAKDGS